MLKSLGYVRLNNTNTFLIKCLEYSNYCSAYGVFLIFFYSLFLISSFLFSGRNAPAHCGRHAGSLIDLLTLKRESKTLTNSRNDISMWGLGTFTH